MRRVLAWYISHSTPSLPFYHAFKTMKDSNGCSVYVDASRDNEIAGLGYAIRGSVNHSDYKFLEGEYTSMEAEFHALLEGVRVASARSSDRVMCEAYTDAKPLVSKMKTVDDDREDWRNYRKSFLWLINKFDSWELKWCSRQNNEIAHELAVDALETGRRSINSSFAEW